MFGGVDGADLNGTAALPDRAPYAAPAPARRGPAGRAAEARRRAFPRRAPARPLPPALLRPVRRARRRSSRSSGRRPRSSCRPPTREAPRIESGDTVVVRSNGTSVELRARVNRRLVEGVARVAERARGRPAPARRGGEAVSFPALLLSSGSNGEPWWISVIKAAIVINLVLFTFAYLTLAERKMMGRMQLRYGPNRVGPVRAAAADRRPRQADPQGELLPGGRDRRALHLRPVPRRVHGALHVLRDPVGARAGRSTATRSTATSPTCRSR